MEEMITFDTTVDRWKILTLLFWPIPIILQLITIIGPNLYTIFPSYDFYTHLLFNMVIFMSVLAFIKFPQRYDCWRYWFPIQIGLMIIFEVFELYVTANNIVFVLGPISWVIKATVENSIYDVAVGFVSLPIVGFLWYTLIEIPRLERRIREHREETLSLDQLWSADEIEELVRP